MSRKTLPGSLGPLARRNGLPLRLPRPRCRQFSSTPAYGVSAIFNQTGNAELNGWLDHIQTKIIFPAYLPEKQRKIVFDPKKQSYLRENPVIIEVEGVEHMFPSINRFKDVKNARSALREVTQMMVSREEWQNIGPLLAGYRKAGIRLKTEQRTLILHRAGQTGNIHTIIECLQQGDETGLTLTEHPIVVLTFMYIALKIAQDAAEAPRAAKWSEVIQDLLYRPPHLAQSRRILNMPYIRGMVLYARASAIKTKQATGADVKEDLTLLRDDVAYLEERLGRRTSLDGVLKRYLWLRPWSHSRENFLVNGSETNLPGSAYVGVLALNIRGITLAHELLGGEMTNLTALAAALDEQLNQFAKEGCRQGWDERYEKIVGSSPKWASYCRKQESEAAIEA